MPYVPVDLTGVCNTGLESLGDGVEAPLGRQLFHGLPFEIGSNRSRCFVAPRPGSAVEIPVDRIVRFAIVAQRLLEPSAIGNVVATYEFVLAHGDVMRVPIRARFEIAAIPDERRSPRVRPLAPGGSFR